MVAGTGAEPAADEVAPKTGAASMPRRAAAAARRVVIENLNTLNPSEISAAR
jgi:hypothetical protein